MNLSTKLRTGFTLVELLFVVAIITVLSTMALGIMKSAQEDAKESATRSRIKQIESMLLVELEDYEVRRLPISIATLGQYVQANQLSGSRFGVQVLNLKRRILQDIINAEIPRPTILVDGGGMPIRDGDGNLQFEFNTDLGVPGGSPAQFPTTKRAGTGNNGFTDWLNSNYPGLRGQLSTVRPARFQAWANFAAGLEPTDATSPLYYEKFNLPGEYLYQLLAIMDFDGAPAIEVLGNPAIGNSDGDAFPEVIDAFGEPLQIRIWQVAAVEVDASGAPLSSSANPTTDIWQDVPTVDFDVKDPDGIPTGYGVLDPTIPRETNKIRFEIISTRLTY